MAYHVSVNDINELFYQDYMADAAPANAPTREIRLPEVFTHGAFTLMKSGNTAVCQSHVKVAQDVMIDEAPVGELFSCGFGLEGDAAALDSLENTRLSLTLQVGQIDFFYAPEHEPLRSTIAKDQQIRRLSLFPSREELIDYALSFDNHELANTLATVRESQALGQFRLTQGIQQTGRQLLHNPYRGAMHALYRETLLCQLKVQLMTLICTHQHATFQLSEWDKAQIHRARELLLQDLSDPTSIAELSRQVGLNKDKLKKGFKVVFNNTVFKTLTESRMQRAMAHLQSNDMSVAEIAYDAGYEDVSAFIRAFRKYAKTTPRAFRKQRCSVLMPHR